MASAHACLTVSSLAAYLPKLQAINRATNGTNMQPTRIMQGRSSIFKVHLVWAVFLAAATVLCAAEEKIWHVKAVHPEGRLLDVKAIDKQGSVYPVKAIEADGNAHLLDIKALVAGKRLPVKVLVSEDKFAPIKAIAED